MYWMFLNSWDTVACNADRRHPIAARPSVCRAAADGSAMGQQRAISKRILDTFAPITPIALRWGVVLMFAALLAGETLYPCHAAGFVLVASGTWISCHRASPVLSSAPVLFG